jgi:hypothetical protein
MSDGMPTIIEWSERFPLREVFTRGQANPVPERTGGVYMWGYDANDKEIIWYVGSATNFRTRLRQHYLLLMSCQYQLPKGFLNGSFKELADVASGWACDLNNPLVLERLRDWEHMQYVHRAAHAFANQAFARIARIGSASESELRAIEFAVIYDLQPIINHRHKSSPNHVRVTHVPPPTEHDWLQGWRVIHNDLVKQGVVKGVKGEA